jgi:hypothetical protein
MVHATISIVKNLLLPAQIPVTPPANDAVGARPQFGVSYYH